MGLCCFFLLEGTFRGNLIFSHMSALLIFVTSVITRRKKYAVHGRLLFFSSIYIDPLKRELHFAYLLALYNLAAIFFLFFFLNSFQFVNVNTSFRNNNLLFFSFSQQPLKLPTSLSSPKTRWWCRASQWLYLVWLWATEEWFSGPKMAWHWVEKETYQVPSLTPHFLLPLLFIYRPLSLSLSCSDQCQVSLEINSPSVNQPGFTQVNGQRRMHRWQIIRCCTDPTLICCLAF